MDAFESLVAMLLVREGYWTARSVKVNLTKKDKLAIGLPSSPRWEIDVVAYSGLRNELLAVECKSFLDSTGVIFREGRFEPERRYKLFTNDRLRKVVLRRLRRELVNLGACPCDPRPRIQLGLAVGHLARNTDRKEMDAYFKKRNWKLFDDKWIATKLHSVKTAGYENDMAFVVAKILHKWPSEVIDAIETAP
jgi:hypothetical protein